MFKKRYLLLLALVLVFCSDFAIAAVTVSNNTEIKLGSGARMRYFDLAFDSSYASGGESLSAITMGFAGGRVRQVRVLPKDGYTFEYDETNAKVKVFANAPPIVYEEKHTSTALASGYTGFYLDYPAAWIVSMADTLGPQIWVKTGMATADLGTDEFCLYEAISDGARTAIVTPTGAGVYYVTYATQAWSDLYEQLVQAEAVTLTPVTAVPLSYTIMAFGYCNLGTDSNNLLPIDPADTPADGEIGINYGGTTLEANAAQGAYTTTVTYLKLPDSGWIYDRYISDEDPTVAASGAYTKATLDYPVLLWATSCYATATGGTSRGIALSYTVADAGMWIADFNVGSSASPAGASVATTGRGTVWVTGNIEADSTMTNAAYIKGRPWEIPNVKAIEVKNGADLSGLTGIKVQVLAR